MATVPHYLDMVRVASPCPVSWGGMAGDERARFCSRCQQHVFNLSEMTQSEAESLVQSRQGRLCVRHYLREDGKIMIRDCPESARRRFRRLLALAAATLLSFGVAMLASMRLALDAHAGDEQRMTLANRIVAWLHPMPSLREPPPPVQGRLVMGKLLPPPQFSSGPGTRQPGSP
jgi:hypothetical protein